MLLLSALLCRTAKSEQDIIADGMKDFRSALPCLPAGELLLLQHSLLNSSVKLQKFDVISAMFPLFPHSLGK